MPRNKRGRETIGIAVCKKKYAPFRFYRKQTKTDDEEQSATDVQVERMFGCPLHHGIRKEMIAVHGERKGWEPFGQWSLRKAQDAARRESSRLQKDNNTDVVADWESVDSPDGSGIPFCEIVSDNKSRCTTLCINGNCLWKVKSAYDDVQEELLHNADDTSYPTLERTS